MAVLRIIEDFEPRVYFSVVWKCTQIQHHHHRMSSLLNEDLPQMVLDNLEQFSQRFSEVIDSRTNGLIQDHHQTVESRLITLLNYWIRRLSLESSDKLSVNQNNSRVVRRLKNGKVEHRVYGTLSALALLFDYEDRNLLMGIEVRERFQDVVQVNEEPQQI